MILTATGPCPKRTRKAFRELIVLATGIRLLTCPVNVLMSLTIWPTEMAAIVGAKRSEAVTIRRKLTILAVWFDWKIGNEVWSLLRMNWSWSCSVELDVRLACQTWSLYSWCSSKSSLDFQSFLILLRSYPNHDLAHASVVSPHMRIAGRFWLHRILRI